MSLFADTCQSNQSREAFWLNADPAGLAGGLNLYGYTGNDPISKVDPLGLFTTSIGAQASSSIGLQGSVSAQFTFSANGWNPLDWRIGSTASITPATGVSTSALSGLGVLVSYAPYVNEPEEFSGPTLTIGVSGGRGAGAGFDVSNISSDSCTHKINRDKLNYNLFVGLKGATLPGSLPVEAHVGVSYTDAGSISPREILTLLFQ